MQPTKQTYYKYNNIDNAFCYVTDEHHKGFKVILNGIRLDLKDSQRALEMLVLLQELFAIRLGISLDQVLQLRVVVRQVARSPRYFSHQLKEERNSENLPRSRLYKNGL